MESGTPKSYPYNQKMGGLYKTLVLFIELYLSFKNVTERLKLEYMVVFKLLKTGKNPKS